MANKAKNFISLVKYVRKYTKLVKRDFKAGKSQKELHEHANNFYRDILRHYGVNVKIDGLENLIPGPAILCQNHTSAMDIPSIADLPEIKYFFAKKELFKYPLFGKALERLGMPMVDRSTTVKAIRSLYKAGDMIIEEGEGKDKEDTAYLLVYPEGTRSKDKDYKMGDFRIGAFALSLEKGLPIIPISSYGALDVVEKKSFDVKEGTIHLKIHPAFYPKDYYDKKAKDKSKKEAVENLLKDVRAAIKDGIGELIKKYKT